MVCQTVTISISKHIREIIILWSLWSHLYCPTIVVNLVVSVSYQVSFLTKSLEKMLGKKLRLHWKQQNSYNHLPIKVLQRIDNFSHFLTQGDHCDHALSDFK